MAKKGKNDSSDRNDLVNDLADIINKSFKHNVGKTAYFLEGDDDAPVNVKEWVSTGSTILDIAISGKPIGGFPIGRITEITGLEASGKSLLAAHALANTQKLGGIAILMDTETSVSKEFFDAIGVDLKTMIWSNLETIEDIFEAIEKIIEKIRIVDNNKLITIVVDSIAGATTKMEQEADYARDGYATGKAIVLSKAMRKITRHIGTERVCLIFTNQLRQKLGGSTWGDPWTTSGGKSLAFHSSVRLRLKSLGKIKAKDVITGHESTVGIKTRAIIIKNRLAPPHKEIDYNIYFDSGIDDLTGWLDEAKNHGIIETSGGWNSFTDLKTGEIIKFQQRDFSEKILEVEYLKKSLCEQVYKAMTIPYKVNPNAEIYIDQHDNGEG